MTTPELPEWINKLDKLEHEMRNTPLCSEFYTRKNAFIAEAMDTVRPLLEHCLKLRETLFTCQAALYDLEVSKRKGYIENAKIAIQEALQHKPEGVA